MRKLLGFFVAAVFVATAASSAMAVPVNILLSTGAGGTTSSKFTAEVAWLTAGTFGFQLKYLSSGNSALPTPLNTATAEEVAWLGTYVVANPPTPGTPGFVKSYVYGEIANELSPGAKILFYTDNTNGTDYIFPGSVSTVTSLGTMIEVAPGATTASGTGRKIDLAYRILSAAQFAAAGAGSTEEANVAAATIDEIEIGTPLTPPYDAYYGTYFVKDLAMYDNTTAAKDAVYNKIANGEGTRAGDNGAGVVHNIDVGTTAYMFFAANFETARKGFKYGTDTLTVEVINE